VEFKIGSNIRSGIERLLENEIRSGIQRLLHIALRSLRLRQTSAYSACLQVPLPETHSLLSAQRFVESKKSLSSVTLNEQQHCTKKQEFRSYLYQQK
jgi:hypothetical protein